MHAGQHPWGQGSLGLKVLRADPQPAPHRPATHYRHFGGRGRDKSLGIFGRHTYQDPSLTAGGDGHIAIDQESQPPEHPLLAEAGFTREKFSNTVGEIHVVGHPTSDVSVAPHPRQWACRLFPRVGKVRRAPGGARRQRVSATVPSFAAVISWGLCGGG